MHCGIEGPGAQLDQNPIDKIQHALGHWPATATSMHLQILFVNGPRGARNPGLGAHVLDLGLETQTTNIWGLVAFRRVVLVHTGVLVDIGVSKSPIACSLGRLGGRWCSDCSSGPNPMFSVGLLVEHWGK